jgi:mono/diheme cytochrome c family protein
MSKIISALFAGAVILAAVWFVSARGKSPLRAKQEASESYAKFCSGCHGAKLEKPGMPALEKTFTDSDIKVLSHHVRKGIPDEHSLGALSRAGMLSWDLAAIFISLFKHPGT